MQTPQKLNIVIFGLSITSSWGNGHATTFRSLIKALNKRGHSVTFFEKDVPWYAANRDLPSPPFCQTVLYQSAEQLRDYEAEISQADLVILGSYVPEVEIVAAQVNALSPTCFAFYDIDTPVTLAKLDRNDFEYLHPAMISRFNLYLSFSGGPILKKLEQQWGAQRARPLYCSVDPDLYYPAPKLGSRAQTFALGYLGTYSDDRQPRLQKLLLDTAVKMPESHFCVAGAQYPDDIQWPANITRAEHVPPHEHCDFYSAQKFTLNVTRGDMISAGFSPSVRLFEAGACGIPIISDYWEGLDTFFTIGKEVLVADTGEQVLEYLAMSEQDRHEISARARQKVLENHTAAHRAIELENYWRETLPSARATSICP